MSTALICKCTVFLMLTLKAFSVPLPDSSQSLRSSHLIFLHTDMFKDNYCNVTPTHVGAFKFFCALNYKMSSIVEQYEYLFVSDNVH